MATATLTSASGFIALLDEKEEDALKEYALKQLDTLVDQLWPEIAGSVSELCVSDAPKREHALLGPSLPSFCFLSSFY